MNIGFIGAGAMAQTLTQHATRSGHNVMLSNSRGPDSLNSIADALGCKVGSAHEAAFFGEVVVIAVPLHAYKKLPRQQLEGKVVLDLLNYFPHRDGHISEMSDTHITTSELLSGYLAGAKVVKAFNSITVQDLKVDARRKGAHDRRAIPIASDDSQAKAVAAQLVDDFGFDAADGGKLADSWRFERFRPAYCVAAPKDKLERILAATTRDSVVADGHWIHTRYI